MYFVPNRRESVVKSFQRDNRPTLAMRRFESSLPCLALLNLVADFS
jgi:hypothetical protein